VKAVDEDTQVILKFGDKDEFSVTYPENYPNSDDNFFVFSERMDAFNDAMQDVCDKKMSFAELLTHAATAYLKHAPASDDEGNGGDGSEDDFKLTGDDDDDFNADDDFAYNDEKKKKDTKKEYDAVDEEFANKKFLEIGSPTASLRLLKDLKTIRRSSDQKLGFTANPVKEPGKNLENLYRWEVKLFDFDGDLGKDLSKQAKKTIDLEMRFSKDYPFAPPFVRVVRPRFKFQTGHVTMGGSICMELLTNSGWRSTNDIESILIQIRAEMQSGGARLDGDTMYNENEAWDAFYRAANNHGWDVKNLNANMFPRV
jgi:ubiquitin-conjugating enzyme E2 Q